jgi:hypothetical protein
MSTAWERRANEPALDIRPYEPGEPINALRTALGKGAARA